MCSYDGLRYCVITTTMLATMSVIVRLVTLSMVASMCACKRGTQIQLTNFTPTLLRVVPRYRDQDLHKNDAVFLPANGTYRQTGYDVRVRLHQSMVWLRSTNISFLQAGHLKQDVTFVVQRFCPGVDSSVNAFGDNYASIANVVVCSVYSIFTFC